MMGECKECEAKSNEINSRFRHLENVQWDYERIKGKGKFKKDHPNAAKIMDSLLQQRVEMAMEHANGHRPEGMEEYHD